MGTKALNSALRFIDIAVKKKFTRNQCSQHIKTILEELTLPLMLCTSHEFETFQTNEIEYVRLQVDASNAFNVKRVTHDLIKNLCNIKLNRKQKISNNLIEFLGMICENLANPS